MATSAVASFIDAPSVDQLEGLLKDDLFVIADHYQVTVPRQVLKPRLLELVREGLEEKGILLMKDEGSPLKEGSQIGRAHV